MDIKFVQKRDKQIKAANKNLFDMLKYFLYLSKKISFLDFLKPKTLSTDI